MNKIDLIERLVNKYKLSFSEFEKQLESHAKFCKSGKPCMVPAHDILEILYSYKLKQATKNGKSLKNDPRKKAIVDISYSMLRDHDKITEAEEGSIEEQARDLQKSLNRTKVVSKSTSENKLNKYELLISRSPDSVRYTLFFDGHICIPFHDCLIYKTMPETYSHMIDLKDELNGKYSGSIYCFSNHYSSTQANFTIERQDFKWKLQITLPLGLRPLGQGLSNLGMYIFMLSRTEDEILQTYLSHTSPIEVLAKDLALNLLSALNYLSSYRSKITYKMSGKDNLYVLADKSDDLIKDYLVSQYPNHTAEKLNGWLANGYWKLMDSKFIGVDSKGKPIKGMTWEIPYDESEVEICTSGEQVTRIVPIHAIERAKERYGIDLSTEDLETMANMILAGKGTKLSLRDKFGRVHSSPGKKGCYRINYNGQTMDVALTKGLDRSSYRISTILPKPKDIKYLIRDSKDCADVMGLLSENS